MRLVSYDRDGRTSWGVLSGSGPLGGDRILDLTAARPGLPADLVDILADRRLFDRVRTLVAGVGVPTLAVGDVRLLAPIPRPRKLVCVGYNYRGHEAIEDPAYPDVFAKTPNTVIGPGETILLPPEVCRPDYEAEIGVVVGAGGRRIPPERAWDHVAGLTIVNDFSARDWQGHGSQWLLGKSFDTFAPMGPALVTLDEIGDVGDLVVQAAVNGVVTLRQSTAAMVFPIPRLISYISEVMTLDPGDVIATGTPQKLPDALAEGRWVRPGDEISISITGLGTLTNPAGADPDPSTPPPTRKAPL